MFSGICMVLLVIDCDTNKYQDLTVLEIHGLFDVNWVGDLYHKGSTSGYLIN